MIKFKVDILEALKAKGFSSYTLAKKNLLSGSSITKLRNHDTTLTLKNIDVICTLLQCQPADLIEWVNDNDSN